MSGLRPMVRAEVLAETWGSSLSTIYDLLKRKNDPLPGYKLGRSWHIDPVEAEEWKQRQRNGAAA